MGGGYVVVYRRCYVNGRSVICRLLAFVLILAVFLGCPFFIASESKADTASPVYENGAAGFVERMYVVALGRPSETSGKSYWISQIQSGKQSGADCVRSFLFSDEFRNRNLTPEQFLDVLYLALFDRAPEKNGKLYWNNEIRNGRITRRKVVECFLDTTEWCNICAGYGVRSGASTAKANRASAAAEDFATRLYSCCLNRDPEPNGFSYWSLALTNWEKTGAEAAQAFFESPEFLAKPISQQEYLTRLYKTYLGREPDPSGTEYWMGEFSKGKTRQYVRSVFARSTEFETLCANSCFAPNVEYVDLIAVGDNLYHQKIIDSGKQWNGTRNYDSIYANIKDHIKNADIKVINQEVILTGNPAQWSGYPTFGCPLEAGQAVVNAGFNVITHATNHSWDKGRAGAMESVSFWKSKQGILLTGMYSSWNDYNSTVIGEYNGVKVAFLNYTYGLNGYTLPFDCRYIVKLLNMDLVCSDIQKARKQADIVIVFPHWGEEYTNNPTSAQRSMARQMANAGADLIIGCHPHVIQPLEIITTNGGRKVPCYYSLGNFVSNMPQPERCVEAMAKVRIKKEGKKVSIESAEALPLVNYIHASGTRFTVYRLSDYTDTLSRNSRNPALTPGFVNNYFYRVFRVSRYVLG